MYPSRSGEPTPMVDPRYAPAVDEGEGEEWYGGRPYYADAEEKEEDDGWYAPAPARPRSRRASLLGGQSAADTAATVAILGGFVWFGWYMFRTVQSGGKPIYGNDDDDDERRPAADGGMRVPTPPEEVQVGDVSGRPKHIPAPLEASAVNNLPVQVSIVVPSTRGAEPVSDTEYRKRIDETKRWFSSHFGGDTTVRGQGDYVDDSDGLISEDVAIVESSMSVRSYQENVDDLAAFIVEMRETWDQDTVLYKVEDQVFIYPERDYIDDTAYPSNIVEVL